MGHNCPRNFVEEATKVLIAHGANVLAKNNRELTPYKQLKNLVDCMETGFRRSAEFHNVISFLKAAEKNAQREKDFEEMLTQRFETEFQQSKLEMDRNQFQTNFI